MIFNTHTHINDESVENISTLIDRCNEANVIKMLAIGYDIKSSIAGIKLSKQYTNKVYCAIGIHPSNIEDINAQLVKLEELLENEKVDAIGEIGLDYYWDKSKIEEQKYAFEEQIKLAVKYKKCIVIHCRDAYLDTYNILEKYATLLVGCVMHCYSGSVEMAKRFLNLGCYIALGGVVTFKNAKEAKEVARQIPLDRLLVETDDPYLTPVPFRGQKNEPSYVTYVVMEIARIKELTYDAVANATYYNALKVLSI